LFADLSGFTPLTEALVRALGPQRGAEELTRQLNLVYDALIGQVENYRGTVIGFSGDAITCWFDDEQNDPNVPPSNPEFAVSNLQSPSDALYRTTLPSPLSSLRALAAALAMQEEMQNFAAVRI